MMPWFIWNTINNEGTENNDLNKVIDTTEYDKYYGSNPKDLIGVKKPRLSYIPPSALVHLSKAMENGAKKYKAYNWRSNEVQTMIYIDAALRHLLSFLDGEDFASDSGVHHLAHMMACGAIILDAIENKKIIDDRPPKGNTSEIIERFTNEKEKK